MSGKKIIVISGLIIAISIPVTLTLIYQSSNTSSRAASPDQLETEGGTLSSTGVSKQNDTSASGGQFVLFSNQTGSPTPTKTPTPTPSGNVINVPTSIDSTGATNVSAALQTFIDGTPNGSTIVFRSGGTYRLGSAIRVRGKHNFTLDGNGARVEPRGTSGTVGSSAFIIENGSVNTTVRGFTVVGDNIQAGTNAACCDRQGQHGIAVFGSTGTIIEDMDIRRVWGDCLYLAASSPGVWSDGVTYRDSTCALTGRHGIGVIAVRHLLIERVVFDEIGFDVVDIEPNTPDDGVTDLLFQNNTVGSYGLTDELVSWLLAACGPDKSQGAVARDVEVIGNTVEGNVAGYAAQRKAINLRVCGEDGPRSDFVVKDNTSAFSVDGPALRFNSVAGVTVTGNRQPLSSGSLVSSSGSTNVVVSGNVTN